MALAEMTVPEAYDDVALESGFTDKINSGSYHGCCVSKHRGVADGVETIADAQVHEGKCRSGGEAGAEHCVERNEGVARAE